MVDYGVEVQLMLLIYFVCIPTKMLIIYFKSSGRGNRLGLRSVRNYATPFHNFFKIVSLRSVPHNQAKPTANPLLWKK